MSLTPNRKRGRENAAEARAKSLRKIAGGIQE
jgi:hypothetical protein